MRAGGSHLSDDLNVAGTAVSPRRMLVPLALAPRASTEQGFWAVHSTQNRVRRGHPDGHPVDPTAAIRTRPGRAAPNVSRGNPTGAVRFYWKLLPRNRKVVGRIRPGAPNWQLRRAAHPTTVPITALPLGRPVPPQALAPCQRAVPGRRWMPPRCGSAGSRVDLNLTRLG